MIWTADTIKELVDRHAIVARVRFSTSADLVLVEVYCMNDIPADLDATLKRQRWIVQGDRTDLTAGIVGRLYSHTDITPQRHRRTREILLRFIDAVRPTSEMENVAEI